LNRTPVIGMLRAAVHHGRSAGQKLHIDPLSCWVNLFLFDAVVEERQGFGRAEIPEFSRC